MVNLIASPVLDYPPLELGALRLEVFDPGPVTAIMPYYGQQGAVDGALQKAHGFGWPEPGHVIAGRKGRVAWSARGTALVIGVEVGQRVASHAALTAQGDGLTALRLSGPGWRDALARLTPLTFERAAERGQLQHVPALFLSAPEAAEIYFMRSMAQTAWHEVQTAMALIEARAALGQPKA